MLLVSVAVKTQNVQREHWKENLEVGNNRTTWHQLCCHEAHLYFSAGFLDLDTVDTWGCIILCNRNCSVHCWMFNRSNN